MTHWMPSKTGVVVTLFLAMAAVQFVTTEHQPASSYLMPTQVAHGSAVHQLQALWYRCGTVP